MPSIHFLITRPECKDWSGLQQSLGTATAHQFKKNFQKSKGIKIISKLNISLEIQALLNLIKVSDIAKVKSAFVSYKHVPLEMTIIIKYLRKVLRPINGVIIPPSGTPLPSQFLKENNAKSLPAGEEDCVNPHYQDLILELCIAIAAHQLKIPIAGFCHGAQMLWFLSGGDLTRLPRINTLEDNPFYQLKEHTIDGLRQGFFVDYGFTKKNSNLPRDATLDAGYETDDNLEESYQRYDFEHSIIMIPHSDMEPLLRKSATSHFIHKLCKTEFKTIASINKAFFAEDYFAWIQVKLGLEEKDGEQLQLLLADYKENKIDFFQLHSSLLDLFYPYIGLVGDLFEEYIIHINKNPQKYFDKFLDEDIYEAIRCAKNSNLILRQDHPWKHLDSPPGIQTMLLVAQRTIEHHQQKSEEKRKQQLKKQFSSNRLKLFIDISNSCRFFPLQFKKQKSESLIIKVTEEQLYNYESSRTRLKMRPCR
ncbi:MAG: hypothetical protein PSV35_10180 [bacterium]|nr:hypothetical protein [bacterium]